MLMEITSCLTKPDDKAIYDALVELGLTYRNYLFRVCELHNYLPLANASNNPHWQFVPTQEVDPPHRASRKLMHQERYT
jgi:hypothetical protein